MKRTVHRSAIIEAPIDRVWAVLRDFNSHHLWHPAVAHSQMGNGFDGDIVGGVRRFNLVDGAEVREQLLHHRDIAHTFSYSILDSSLPFFDYIATVRLRTVTDGNHTFLDWRSRFHTAENRAEELKHLVGQQIYEVGFSGLRKYLAEDAVTPLPPSEEIRNDLGISVVGEDMAAKAMRLADASESETMSLVDVTIPAPAPDQVRIRQRAIGVNDVDINQGLGADAQVSPSDIPGMEGVGEILDVGKHVHGLFPGDRVAYISPEQGAYAEIRCIDADACIPLPEPISDIEASILLKGFTAGLLLNRVLRPGRGSTLMIEAVSGGLGHIISQWAKSLGLTVLGTVTTVDEARFSRDHGCDYPIITGSDSQLIAEVMRVTNGRGVEYWVQNDGGNQMGAVLSCMAFSGHIAFLSDPSICIDVAALNQRSRTVSAPSCLDYARWRPFLQRIVHKLFMEIEKRNIVPAIESVPLSQAHSVFKRVEKRQVLGAMSLIPIKSV
jgi:NADPH2:quinone reductase